MRDLALASLLHDYRAGLKPADLVAELRVRIAAHADHHAWITLLDEAQLAPHLARLEGQGPDTLPLYGIPFAIKDNIDLAGVPTTAACPDFAYTPQRSATVVQRLLDAGAIPLGKTNLDQFATGLVGTRSPYGAVRNAFDPAYISGGSSAGSAVALALGEVSFSLGTDTAGSGRVPAGFNNLLGIKPTRGRWSIAGVVPACRSLDCPSLFALNPEDARRIGAVMDGADSTDPWSRRGQAVSGPLEGLRLGVLRADQLEFFGNAGYAALFAQAMLRWQSLGAELVQLDFAPFSDVAKLLYEGPWVAERRHATQAVAPESMLPVIRQVLAKGEGIDAVGTFDGFYRLQALKRAADTVLAGVHAVLTPTAPTHYRIAELEAEPLLLNSRLGTYTNFMNLLDYAAVAAPAGMTPAGLPFGITLFGPAWSDDYLLALAQRWMAADPQASGRDASRWTPQAPPAPPGRIEVAVCGAHLSGMPLNHQLTSRGAFLVAATRSAPCYRLIALAGGPPFRPGMIRDADRGAAIEVEVWSVPEAAFGSFVAGIPAPLGIGKLELAGGRWVSGFICESVGEAGARDITHLGGWRAYVSQSANERK
ncbi:allophanate hydrolase [Solimonas sp. K1W22B-7]|uniref:allophanate hydrolase n=1 Tax=Solimonas sp. K1W22B-7 TaxID=2303331 RepID=UPI000E32F8D4|nr:allophanate hydrolase [Solimonas sp. K1W22B-7]AXQ29668.1 allophanate hydrolase [Solimonas sp. K1W22B-7]